MIHLKAIALFTCLLGAFVQGNPITFDGYDFVYDGTPKSPTVSAEPNNLSFGLHYDEPSAPDPTPVSGRLYNTIPETLALSYSSLSFAAQSTMGLGDAIIQKPGAGVATAVQVVMVNWARKSQWPAHALLNPEGYLHPITISAYRQNASGSLELIAESTEDILIPWRPDTLPDGSPYPFNGIAFIATIPFETPIQLPQEVFLMVSYNTSNFGFKPLLVPGPYDTLNVALATHGPTDGTDLDPGGSFWIRPNLWSYPATGVKPPMFRLIGLVTPPRGTTAPPSDAGSYVVTATWLDGAEKKSTSHPYTISPATAQINFEGLKGTADGHPKFPTASTVPAGLPIEWSFNGGNEGPVTPGEHTVAARIKSRNYVGEANTSFILGISREDWMRGFTAEGLISPAESGNLDDPDKDGMVNLLEYAIGSRPDHADAGKASGISMAGNGQHFRFSYRRNPLATNVHYSIEASENLSDPAAWTEVTPSDQAVSREGDQEKVEVSIPALSQMNRHFFRLRVTTTE